MPIWTTVLIYYKNQYLQRCHTSFRDDIIFDMFLYPSFPGNRTILSFVQICEFLLQRHNLYAIRYWTCECMCLVNVLAQLYLMNVFFDGEFLSYGLRVLNFSETTQDNRIDPMVYIFPRVTKCIFHKYGASGSIQKHDSLCILPLNIVNEKTYIFIWFWFILLAMMLTILVIYRYVLLNC